MGQSSYTPNCTATQAGSAPASCAGHGAITVIDTSWGVPGLGLDGTIALGAMAIAAATVSLLAWRALSPVRSIARPARFIPR